MPARNDGREGADPKAVSALDCLRPAGARNDGLPGCLASLLTQTTVSAPSPPDCFALRLAMTTARPTRQPPHLNSLVSLTAQTIRNCQIDIIPHCSFIHQPARRDASPASSPSLTRQHTRKDNSPAPTQNYSSLLIAHLSTSPLARPTRNHLSAAIAHSSTSSSHFPASYPLYHPLIANLGLPD
jgi:hypothetical protein